MARDPRFGYVCPRVTPRGYILFVLTSLSALNHLDRQLMYILLEPARREFGLTDVQLGLLSGFAFALVDTTLSIPAALWAVVASSGEGPACPICGATLRRCVRSARLPAARRRCAGATR